MASLAESLVRGLGKNLFRACSYNKAVPTSLFHTSSINQGLEPRKWLSHNNRVEPPNPNDTERPPAWVCHMRANIKYSPKKMWYICELVHGMTVDEAIKQLSFVHKKGAHIVKEVIQEAQEIAVRDHNVEYKSNLWIAESFCGKGKYMRGLRRHARSRFYQIEYKYCHYFVRLEEGAPPKNIHDRDFSNSVKLENFVQSLRSRTVTHSL